MFLDELEKINGVNIRKDVSLCNLTTFRIGGVAKLLLMPKNLEALREVWELLNKYEKKYQILGCGSNILVNNRDFEVVLSTVMLDGIDNISENDNGEAQVTFYAGFSIKKALSWLYKNSLTGFEDLTGIPGSIGGAIKMNAGIRDFCISDNLKEVLVLDNGYFKWIKRRDINFSYRKSDLDENALIVAGRFGFLRGQKRDISHKILLNIKKRCKNQPISKASAGCVFKNPIDVSAGKLIDMCGLKGETRGNAMISYKHANFIVNNGNATFNDVIYLMEKIKDNVYNKTGYILENEVRVWY